MRRIRLDAREWKAVSDVYNAILRALDAPGWHGRNVNALVESILYGQINAVEPPYIVEIHSAFGAPHDVTQELNWVRKSIMEARAHIEATRGHDVLVAFNIID